MQQRLGAAYLVTGHHADDQAETVLYRVLRGSGMAGLAGIPRRAPGGLVRPLLPFRRTELLEYLEHRFAPTADRPPVFDDPANSDPRHDRSWLRHRIVPLLRERLGDDLERRLSTVARHAARDRAAWSQVLRVLSELQFRRSGGAVEVARAPLARYDKVLSETILRALAREVGCAVSTRRAARLLAFVSQSASGRRFELGGGWEAELVFDRVRLAPAARGDGSESPSEGAWGDRPAGSTQFGEWVISWRSDPAEVLRREGLSTWVTPGRGEVRAARAGDRMRPLGGSGSRKVRRMLMEARVPVRERSGYPVIARGTDVLWIPGVCRSADAVPRAGAPALRLDARTAGR
jgi:tRNA(Ile)-lysidine synthase